MFLQRVIKTLVFAVIVSEDSCLAQNVDVTRIITIQNNMYL